jgi:hypothetical protein
MTVVESSRAGPLVSVAWTRFRLAKLFKTAFFAKKVSEMYFPPEAPVSKSIFWRLDFHD